MWETKTNANDDDDDDRRDTGTRGDVVDVFFIIFIFTSGFERIYEQQFEQQREFKLVAVQRCED